MSFAWFAPRIAQRGNGVHSKGPAPIRARNLCCRTGAEALAQTIESYWNERGFEVMVIVTHGDLKSLDLAAARYDVRSDMVNGWPARGNE